MKFAGAHVSIAGGVENAPLNAAAIGATAFAMFTKNQRQWNAPPISEASAAAFKENCRKHGYTPDLILPHDGYLINMGNPDPEKRKNAVAAFTDEMYRCQILGLKLLNLHPGSHLRQISESECLAHIAAGINSALAETEGVVAVLENTAGQGSNLGYTFRQLADIMEQINDPARVGVCIDTCHSFAAGYDLSTPEGYEKTMDEFDRIIGFKYLRGMHLNDAKGVLAGKLDRHDSLGKGNLGMDLFRRLMQDPRIQDIPLILETPDESLWKEEIKTLLSFAAEA
ncbi:MAG: deoxyribonuclease IV [Lentisphaeria bacterium]|nr:deoxyribonuclease IV [Lentisphaeria bacterium]